MNIGATSVGGMINNVKAYASVLMPGVVHMRHTHLDEHKFVSGQPETGAEIANDLERICTNFGAENIAACIVEPIAGSTGTLVPPVGYLQRLRELCDKHNILLIFDEVITSSKIKRILCLSQSSLNLCKYPTGGTSVPVDPAIGSTIHAAIFSAPKFVQILSKSFAISAPVSGWPDTNLCSSKWVCLIWTTPGIKTLAYALTLLIIPPTEVAPIFIPWYALSLPTNLNLWPSPLALWYAILILIAVSTAVDPQIV